MARLEFAIEIRRQATQNSFSPDLSTVPRSLFARLVGFLFCLWLSALFLWVQGAFQLLVQPGDEVWSTERTARSRRLAEAIEIPGMPQAKTGHPGPLLR